MTRRRWSLLFAGILVLVTFSGCLAQTERIDFDRIAPPGGLWEVPAYYDKYVDPVLRETFKNKTAEVAILTLNPDLRDQTLQTLRDLNIDHHLYDQLDMVAAFLPREHLDRVAALEGVEIVYSNEEMHPYLSRAASYVGAKILWDTYKTKGSGVTVLVVDSGIDGKHPDLKYGENLIENAVPTPSSNGLISGHKEGVAASDFDGHGTHVASIVAGLGVANGKSDSNAGKYKGVAFEADLVGFAAGLTNAAGETRFESTTVLEAYNYAIAKKAEHKIRIVSNSWGADGEFDPQSPINLATYKLYKAGLAVTFAAGNEGSEGQGSLNKYCVAPWVLCIAAGDYLNRRASFSSMGRDPAESPRAYDHPDLMAPGVQIVAALSQTPSSSSTVAGTAKRDNGDLYVTKSGTSMATPVVSGTMALLISANPKLSPDQVYDILTASVTALPKIPSWEGGAGYLNGLDAYKLATKTEGNLDAFLKGKVKYGGKSTGDPDLSEDPLSVGLGRGSAGASSAAGATTVEFAKDLTTTVKGLVFLVLGVVLALLAFRRPPKE